MCASASRLPVPVTPVLVAANPLVVSVERSKEREGAFSMLVDEGFASGLSDEELRAMVAHEIGHVWIFTHHPFLHTEGARKTRSRCAS